MPPANRRRMTRASSLLLSFGYLAFPSAAPAASVLEFAGSVTSISLGIGAPAFAAAIPGESWSLRTPCNR